MDKQVQRLRSEGKLLSPILQIGKNGVTDGTISLIDRELREKHLIKIKLHGSALSDDAGKAERKALAARLCSATRATLVEQIGNVIVVYRST